ncbi:MogA/MoaB family molybdenum cofactor biosynthesis protein [Anaerostipes sp.]|uniref:MogA/MoaB family molybdenum cofactor biosynthesis protein n=1 Tax=Anaerostipes sp. TaxID=1872530 RepID=UPI0025C40137|nr:MogA/MoaB family molybdenum cofactor biosynthesis protein [Anaerostipes sp.]MBS7007771.1 MogA/MoaB family molybdenum cofactor biosynthesis protein [Anaerostipes sp.]
MAYRIAVITLSDKGAAGKRRDESGPLVKEMAESEGFQVVSEELLPDGIEPLKSRLAEICDQGLADLILTTGGTGFSERDLTPEATLLVSERQVPGISEAMRRESMKITKRAMLSRGVSVIRKKTLIVNLPGSPKAVRENLEYILDALPHGLGILCGQESECGNPEK